LVVHAQPAGVLPPLLDPRCPDLHSHPRAAYDTAVADDLDQQLENILTTLWAAGKLAGALVAEGKPAPAQPREHIGHAKAQIRRLMRPA
jgi:hypothetical protein